MITCLLSSEIKSGDFFVRHLENQTFLQRKFAENSDIVINLIIISLLH